MKQLILVGVRGKHTEIVHGEASPAIIQTQRSAMIRSGNWKGWKLQIRTKEGYKELKILNPKVKEKKKFNPYD